MREERGGGVPEIEEQKREKIERKALKRDEETR